MITRRAFLKFFGATVLTGASFGAYAFGIEPGLRLRVQRYALTPSRWTAGLKLRLALIADVHACEPWMSADRVARIAERANGLGADLILLLGDYEATHRFRSGPVAVEAWSAALGTLRAPLGVHAIIGNHDWWVDADAQRRRGGPVYARTALEKAGIDVLENDAIRLSKDGKSFWLAGLADQLALITRARSGRNRYVGVDDLPGTLAKVTGNAPVILMAHEPDVFPQVPDRVSLTVSGHTHGGQVRLFGHSPVVPSKHGNRFAYGHIVEGGRDLVVSGGLGCSIAPVRFGVPPEIVLIDLGGTV